MSAAWGFLIIGIILVGIGLAGQFRIRSKTRYVPPADRRTLHWVATLGAIVAGALLLAVWIAQLISYGARGHW